MVYLSRYLRILPLTTLLGCFGASGGTLPPRGSERPNDAPDDSAQGPGNKDDSAQEPGNKDDSAQGPGTKVALAPLAEQQAAFSALRANAEATEKLDLAGLKSAYPTNFRSGLSYAPHDAEFLDRIQASPLALSDGELAALDKNGFVISQRREFPTFLRGLAEIYASHLPLYVSADALLEAVHSSYDQILMQLELAMLIPDLKELLQGMRERLPSADASEQTRAHADLYLTVALSLLEGKTLAPVAGADASTVASILGRAKAAKGEFRFQLFDVDRRDDFSQFEPRGHYTDHPLLQQYFRAMIWLGRVDLRLLETQPNGEQVFRREQYLAMLLLHDLVGPDLPRFQRIDTAVGTFVGESDYMVLGEVSDLVANLGGPAAARTASDDDVARAIVAGDYGKQQIASHLMVNDGTVETLPLNRSFALLGQRYVADSHVFSEVVYDRLKDKRMMPSPLDAAFAALGNSQAVALNKDAEKFKTLPGALGRMRLLIDAHEPSFWSANLYNLWLSALRGLSPASDSAAAGLPQVMATEAWGRRMLNAQLGSWAELRHDTVLYAKQSYTGSPTCDFPDAYVDPYPAFWKALQRYAEAGSRVAELVPADSALGSGKVAKYFETLHQATRIFSDMAERELRGEPFSEEQLAFINRAVRIERKTDGCTTIDVPDGWYADLFFQREKSIEFDPTIADVHTQPTDEAGNTVGKVLHVATGYPRFMVTTVDSCQAAPRAYAGVVFAYHELVTKDYERLNDEEWASTLRKTGPRPADVEWLSPVLAK